MVSLANTSRAKKGKGDPYDSLVECKKFNKGIILD